MHDSTDVSISNDIVLSSLANNLQTIDSSDDDSSLNEQFKARTLCANHEICGSVGHRRIDNLPSHTKPVDCPSYQHKKCLYFEHCNNIGNTTSKKFKKHYLCKNCPWNANRNNPLASSSIQNQNSSETEEGEANFNRVGERFEDGNADEEQTIGDKVDDTDKSCKIDEEIISNKVDGVLNCEDVSLQPGYYSLNYQNSLDNDYTYNISSNQFFLPLIN